MAFAAGAVLEVRTTGSDSQCGGGFNSARGGTDYSQQDTAQATGTASSAGTTVTATTSIFTSVMVGNYITDGVYWREITAYTSGTVVTIDSAPGLPWAAATVYVGGAIASLGLAGSLKIAGNDVWQKSGAYTISSSSSNVSNGIITDSTGGVDTTNLSRWEGYGSTRGDGGTKPTNTFSGISGVNLFTASGAHISIKNITFDCNSASGTNYAVLVSANGCQVRDCVMKNASNGLRITSTVGSSVYNCYFTGCNYGSTQVSALASVTYLNCVSDTSTTGGFFATGESSYTRCVVNGVSSGVGYDIEQNGSFLINCVAYNCSSHGFYFTTSSGYAVNCVAANNGGYGFSAAAVCDGRVLINCAGYSNTSGNVNSTNITRNEGFITLTAGPFTSAGTDFSLNTTSGGGAALRAAGLPGVFPGLSSTTGYLDVGAVQHADPSSVYSIEITSPVQFDRFNPVAY